MIRIRAATYVLPLALVSLLTPTVGFAQDAPGAPMAQAALDSAPVLGEDDGLMFHGRFRLGTMTSALDYTQTSDDVTEVFPPEASFSHAPFVGPTGFLLQTEIWWEDYLALDLGFSWAMYNLKIGNDTVSDSVVTALVGVRGDLEWNYGIRGEWGVWYHHSDAVAFHYEENRTAAAKEDFVIDGLRVGVGAAADLDFMTVRAGVYETFGLAPVNTQIEVTGDVPVFEMGPENNGYPVVLRLSYTADIRHISDSVGDVSLEISETFHTLGAALTLEVDYLDDLLFGS